MLCAHASDMTSPPTPDRTSEAMEAFTVIELPTRCEMKRQAVHFCMGCGQVLDELQPDAGQTQWVDAHRYLMKYGFHWDDLDLIGEPCPPCARVIRAAAPRPPTGGGEMLPS